VKLRLEIFHKNLSNTGEFSETRIIYNNISLERVNDYLSVLSRFVHIFGRRMYVQDTFTLIPLSKSEFANLVATKDILDLGE
jgi:hypothetical protein